MSKTVAGTHARRTAKQGNGRRKVSETVDIGHPTIKPIEYDRFFDDPDEMRALIARHAPYEWIARDFPPEYAGTSGSLGSMPWFRLTWGAETAGDERGRKLLLNERFIDGARQSFQGFQVVRPDAAIINLMAPMPHEGRAHFDQPYYRGLDRYSAPAWLLLAMGRSHLFDRWHVNVASGLVWLYTGQGGGLSYWPDGIDQPPRTIREPVDNRALISDNQRMYHAVDDIGRPEERTPVMFGPRAQMISEGSGGWSIEDQGTIVRSYRADQVRISILWKALVFADARAARIYDEHLDDLTVQRVLDILTEGARQRGFDVSAITEPLEDPRFVALVDKAFPKLEVTHRAAPAA
jgi:hypothetical protein